MPTERPARTERVQIYLAGPLFSEAELRFNAQLTGRLEERGYRVFLPQRDGVERGKPAYDAMTSEERRRAMFDLDGDKIFESDVFLFVLDGRVPDEGACVELGIAHCQRDLQGGQRLLIGLHTDTRAAFESARLNPMVRVPLDRVVDDEDTLLRVLDEHREGLDNGRHR